MQVVTAASDLLIKPLIGTSSHSVIGVGVETSYPAISKGGARKPILNMTTGKALQA
jgi:hypothetical protein